jgi:hypothetical protein
MTDIKDTNINEHLKDFVIFNNNIYYLKNNDDCDYLLQAIKNTVTTSTIYKITDPLHALLILNGYNNTSNDILYDLVAYLTRCENSKCVFLEKEYDEKWFVHSRKIVKSLTNVPQQQIFIGRLDNIGCIMLMKTKYGLDTHINIKQYIKSYIEYSQHVN